MATLLLFASMHKDTWYWPVQPWLSWLWGNNLVLKLRSHQSSCWDLQILSLLMAGFWEMLRRGKCLTTLLAKLKHCVSELACSRIDSLLRDWYFISFSVLWVHMIKFCSSSLIYKFRFFFLSNTSQYERACHAGVLSAVTNIRAIPYSLVPVAISGSCCSCTSLGIISIGKTLWWPLLAT